MDFTKVSAPEPHRERRRRLLQQHPEIRKLYGWDWRPAAITIGVVALQFSLAAWVQRLAARGLAGFRLFGIEAAVALLVGAVLAHWAGVVIHEASHNLCAATPGLNRLVAIFGNLHVPVPAAMSFFRYHLDHHAYMGMEGLDNDLATRIERDFFSRGPLRKLVWIAIYPFFMAFGRGFWRPLSRWELYGAALQVSVDLAVLQWLGPAALGYLFLSMAFGYGLHPVAGHFIHEHYLWNENQETYSYYGLLNAVTWNIGYHNEHHDFVRVPGARLPALRRIAAGEYDRLVSHRSWMGVYWTFIRTKRLGHHSRMVRDRGTLGTGRAPGELGWRA